MSQQPEPPMAASAPPPKPSRIRRWLRWLARGLLALLGLAALYALAVWILGAIPVNRDYRQATSGVDIMITSNGVHTDFYLPARTEACDWTSFAPLQTMPNYLKNSAFVLIGWGDRGFFLDTPTWDDLTVGRALSAVFLPTSSVMHLYYCDYMAEPSERAVRLRLTWDEYRMLSNAIQNSFQKDAAGKAIMIRDRSYAADDVFYEGVGSYHLFHTCNNWASSALAHAGVTSPVWSPFDGAIFAHLPR